MWRLPDRIMLDKFVCAVDRPNYNSVHTAVIVYKAYSQGSHFCHKYVQYYLPSNVKIFFIVLKLTDLLM